MTISHRERAKKDLAVVIRGELSTALSPEQTRGTRLSRSAITALSLTIASRVMASEGLLETLGKFAPQEQSEWLTTEDAAQRSGFSRPFIAALLDSPSFEGRVSKTEKGHRRVDARDFQRWLEKSRPSDLPSDVASARSGPRDEEPTPLEETPAEKAGRIAARKRALAAAKALGIG